MKVTAEDLAHAAAEVERLQRELDITNADHIALWLEANTIPDEPMSQCMSWLACRVVEAHEAAEQSSKAEIERLQARVAEVEAELDLAAMIAAAYEFDEAGLLTIARTSRAGQPRNITAIASKSR